MAVTTTFKKSVPYNTIRLAGDVAQWAQTEQTNADNSSYPAIPNMIDVSMADMQKASDVNIDPDGGVITPVGTLGSMRYGVSVPSDESGGDGVYSSQVDNTSSPFVGSRTWNGKGSNIRLSRMAQWDYTANLEVPDIDWMDISSTTVANNPRPTSFGSELFKDIPCFAWGFYNGSAMQTVVVRAHPNGGRFSSNQPTNYGLANLFSNTTAVTALNSVRSEFGNQFDTQIRSFVAFGRDSTSTGRVRAQVYNILIDPSTNTFNVSESGSDVQITTQFSSNCSPRESCYLKDDLSAVIVGRGNQGHDLLRVDTSSGISATRTSLTTVGSYSLECDVVAIPDEDGSSQYCWPIWMETKSTYNRYVKMAGYDLSTGISNINSAINVFDINNSIKGCGGALLKAGAGSSGDPHIFLVWAADSSGDVRLQVVGSGNGTLQTNTYPSATLQYNDTHLINLVSISALSAVEKTAILKSGENFTPGGTNDFEKRRYFVVGVSTSQEQDTNKLYYGYYDLENKSLVTWDGGGLTGRHTRMCKNDFDTDGRQYARDLYYRGESGAVWMPTVMNRYINSTNARFSFGMASLDYKPNWSGLSNTDPGNTFFDQAGLTGTGGYLDEANVEAQWDSQGRWNVVGPHPMYTPPSNPARFYDQYNSSATFSDGVGANLVAFRFSDRDIDAITWDDFIENTVIPYNINNAVYIRIKTGNLTATYTLPASGGKGIAVVGSTIVVPWNGQSNSHAGSQWGWFWNTTTGETQNAVGITFSQSPF